MKSYNISTPVILLGLLSTFIVGVLLPVEKIKSIKQTLIPAQEQIIPPRYSDYYHHKISFFETNNTHDYDVVFIGDSITDGAEWQELFPTLKIANRGVDADTTTGVINRLNSIYSTSAPKAFVMIGINDLLRGKSIDTTFENYQEIVNELLAHDMEVFIQSILHVGVSRKHLNGDIAELNNKLQNLAQLSPSVRYIDLNAGLAPNLLLNSSFSRDDIHINGDGYAVWANLISPYIIIDEVPR